MNKNKIFGIISIIVANLVPILGVLFLGWSVLFTLIFFWAQGMFDGFFDILKMATASGIPSPTTTVNKKVLSKIDTIADYIYHYYLMTMVPFGIFIYLFFGQSNKFLPEIHEKIISSQFILALIPFLISLILSFYFNFIANGEYKKLAPQDIKISLQSLIALLVIIFGLILTPFVLQYTHLPLAGLSVFILIKLIIELRIYLIKQI